MEAQAGVIIGEMETADGVINSPSIDHFIKRLRQRLLNAVKAHVEIVSFRPEMDLFPAFTAASVRLMHVQINNNVTPHIRNPSFRLILH